MSYIEIGILIALIIVVLFCCFGNNKILVDGFSESFTEGFTNDEALQNVASIYNTGNMSVTNANITNALVAKTATVQGNLGVTGATNLTGNLTSNVAQINNLNANAANINSLTVSSNSNMMGSLAVNGGLYANGTIYPNRGEQANMIYLNQTTQPNQWDQTIWITRMSTYFKKSMPDGTILKFVIVYYWNGALLGANTFYHVVSFMGVKIGNQIMFYELNPRQTDTGNLYTASTNNTVWRGNVTNP